ncbi:MAG TPA: methyltransferase domain-containing protein [Acidimicrobiales bacterium]|nr:methyltransferase domain-containing protein [Acidimicrobiales bacterium]
MDGGGHNDVVRNSFDKQVPLFTGPASVFAARPGAPDRWGTLDGASVVLDVACGAAHVCEQLAPYVAQVVGIDLTPTLLALGAQRLRDAGVRNVLLQEGDAADLPFVDGSFDLVVCRSSVHHLADVERSLCEMRRVCRPGGRVAIDELVQPPAADADVQARYDAVHRLLDPSHLHALTDDDLLALVNATVGPVTSHSCNDPSALPLDAILTDASAREPVWRAIEDELAGGPATGFEPERRDGTVLVRFYTATYHVEVPR